MDHVPIQHRPLLPSLRHFSAVILPNRSHIPPHLCQQLRNKRGALSEESDGVVVRSDENRGERENGCVECRSLREGRSGPQQAGEERKASHRNRLVPRHDEQRRETIDERDAA